MWRNNLKVTILGALPIIFLENNKLKLTFLYYQTELVTYHQRIQLCSTSPKINWKNFHHQTQHFVWQAHSWFNYGWIHAQVSLKYGNNFREQNYTKLLQGQLVELQGFRDHLIFIFITCLRRFVVRHIGTGLIITESKGTWGWDLWSNFYHQEAIKYIIQ